MNDWWFIGESISMGVHSDVMSFLDSEVLAALPPSPKSIHVRDLAHQLGLDGDGRRELREFLKKLSDSGRCERSHGQHYSRARNIGEVTGTLTLTARGFGFVALDGGGEDLYISGRNVGDSMHRDRVRVRIVQSGESDRREGVVTGVIEHGTRTFVGTLRVARHGTWLTPQDPRLPESVGVVDRGDARDGDRVAAEFVTYSDDPEGARARIIKVFGAEGPAAHETEVIVYDLGLPVSFRPESEAAAAAAKAPDKKTISRRHDLRKRPLVTIDPESARDFDDAVHAVALDTGGWTLTVAIADVSHYVLEGSALDEDARERGTSVYLPDRVLPMLPHALSSDLCSLRPLEDRLALVAEFDVGPNGEVGRYTLYEAVINSHARFTYERCAKLLGLRADDDAPTVDADPAFEALRPVLEAALHCTRALRAYRRRRGYLELDLPEPKILLNTNGEISDVVATERNEAHKLVEEAMLAANEVVARHFVASDRPAIFRVHDRPQEAALLRFQAIAQAFEAPLQLKGAPSAGRLSNYLRTLEANPHKRILHQLLLRSMAQAAYNEEAGLHFGLGSPAYVHFTSPIRRYPDLIVHRLIKAELQREAWPDAEVLGTLADHCGRRERLAVDAERTVQDLYKALFLSKHIGEEFSGLVIGVTQLGLFVQLDEHLVEGMVSLGSMRDDVYVHDERANEYRGRRVGQRVGLGARVQIKVGSVDVTRRRVDFAFLALLAGCQIMAAVALAGLCAWNVKLTRDLGRQAGAFTTFQSNRAALDLLVGTSMEYAQKNPAIDTVLAKIGVKKTTVPMTKPAR